MPPARFLKLAIIQCPLSSKMLLTHAPYSSSKKFHRWWVIKPGWSVLALLVYLVPCVMCSIKSKVLQGIYSNFKCPFAANSVILNFGEAKVTAWWKNYISHTSSFSQILATDNTMESNMEGVQNFGLDQSTFCPNIDPLENRWSMLRREGFQKLAALQEALLVELHL